MDWTDGANSWDGLDSGLDGRQIGWTGRTDWRGWIEWTGQAELSESEVSTFGELLSKWPAVIPYDAVVWECELQVRLDSLPDLSEQSFNDSISERPGYPEWCGGIVPDNLTLDGSEPNLPPGEEMYGLHYGYGVYARNETHWMDSWFEQEDCNGEGGYWDEKYDMCAIPTGCPAEVDSQLIYEECLPGQWARYHWSGDYLYIGGCTIARPATKREILLPYPPVTQTQMQQDQ